ncbi:tetratricopeptide repeat protein [Hymenobacter algoricola]|uniref:tetratricopeptide repeat protein n=1 Tax=Hymenobacter algoricola TaxID=486267 RepID=UPI0031ED588E
MLWLPLASQAQRSLDSTPRYLESDALRAKDRINERPRYGGLTKTAAYLQADQEFIAQALRKYGTAQAAMQAHVNFGWHYLATDHAPTAIKRFNQAWLLDSTAADVYYGFSAYLQQQGQTEEAERFLQLGKRHDKGNEALLKYYASQAYGQSLRRDYTGAIATNEKLLALAPTNAFAHGRTGYWYLQQRDTARAAQYLSRAVQLDPQDSVSYLNRGWLRYGQKQYPQAVADYTQAIRINAHYVSAYVNRALAHTDAGNHAAAIADMQHCLTLVPSRDKTEIYYLLAQAQLKAKDSSGACEALKQALEWSYTPAAEKDIKRLMKSTCR